MYTYFNKLLKHPFNHFMIFGRDISMPRDLILQGSSKIQQYDMANIDNMRNAAAYNTYRAVQGICERVRTHSRKYLDYNSKSYARQHSCKIEEFKEGDLVFVKVENPVKFGQKWEGPAVILNIYSSYLLRVQVGSKAKVLNICKIKPFRINKYTDPNKLPKLIRDKPLPTSSKAAKPSAGSNLLSQSYKTIKLKS